MFNSFNPDCGGFIQHFCTQDEQSSNFYYNGYGQYTKQDPFGYASINGYTQPTGDDSRRNPMFQESMNNVQGYAPQQPPQNVGYGDGYPSQQNNGYGYFNDNHFYSSNYDLPGNNNQPTFQQNNDSFDWASISNGGSAFNDNSGNNDMFGYNMDAAVKQMNVDDPFAKGVSQFERQRNTTWDTLLDKTNPMMPPSPSCFGCPKVNEQAAWNNQEALAKANEQSSIMDKVNKSFEMNGRLTRDEDWLNVLKK
jgi:hypothetical protein